MIKDNSSREIFSDAGVVDDSLAKTLMAKHIEGRTKTQKARLLYLA